MFNATCLIKTDIDTVNKCMGQNPYNPETFLQNFASRLTSFDDPLLNIYPTSEIAGNIEDEDVILGLREPQKLIEWAKTMKERTQCMAMAEFSAALQKHKAEGIDITKPMYTCLRSIEMDSNESYLLRFAAELFDNHPNPECDELFYDGDSWKCFPNGFQLKDIEAQQYILKNLNSLGNSVDFWGRKNDRQHVIDGMSTTQKSQLLCYILRNHEAFGKMTCRDWKNWLLDDAEPQFGIWF